MAIHRPYYRTCRQFADGSYAESEQWMYVVHPAYAKSPEHYVRAFLLIQDDLQSLFQYVEPADKNRQCYSFRIHELILRTCIEIEANCKAILVENGYHKSEPTMRDFQKVNASHRLSEYVSRMPIWNGSNDTRQPFAPWREGSHLEWYQAYNRVKHDRHHAFNDATLDNLINAFCALHIILSAQFYINEFRPSDWLLGVESPDGRMQSGLGDFLWIRFPDDWPDEERYDFDWSKLKGEENPFRSFDYSAIPSRLES